MDFGIKYKWVEPILKSSSSAWAGARERIYESLQSTLLSYEESIRNSDFRVFNMNPANTQRRNNVVTTSLQRRDVAATF